MSATPAWPKVMITLIRREFQEHRLLFLYSPLGLTALWLVYAIAAVVRALQLDTIPATAFATGRGQIPLARFLEFSADSRGFLIAGELLWPLFWMMAAFWLTMAYYFLVTLHQQRKNRSILFWNSLPVSDTQTLASKLVAGLLCCHAVFLACSLVVALAFVLALLAFGALAGIDAWTVFIAPVRLSLFVPYLAIIPLSILWTLPVYAWLLLVSAWARQAPFVWAVGPLMLGVYMEFFFTGESWLQRHVLIHAFPFPISAVAEPGRIFVSVYPWSELAASALLGFALVYGAIRLNRSEDR
jgi:ABC-2 type transport system permease protein